MKTSSILDKLLSVFLSFLILISAIIMCSAVWYRKTYGNTGFDSLLFTLTNSISGTANELVFSLIKNGILLGLLLTVAIIFIWVKLAKKFNIRRIFSVLATLAVSVAFLAVSAERTSFYPYVKSHFIKTNIYEDLYCDPNTVNITFPEEKRNLIYIFLESMETTFFDSEQGGALDTNIIPELYSLCEDNINFSDNDDVGGFLRTKGTTWTIGAMVGQSAGVPLVVPEGINGNNYALDSEFLPGVTSLSDILHNNGYYQTLVLGSNPDFGGRSSYYRTHRTDAIYGLRTAIKEGFFDKENEAWWGMVDHYYIDYAKEKILEASDTGKPFAVTMLTTDTHHVGGYICPDCGDARSEKLENVYSCSSKRIYDFVNWLKEQDFYDNTTVIICGDHTSMDNGYIERNVSPDYERKVYNCFINSAVEAPNSKNRTATSLDMFPTTLAAMGCEIDGDQLGFGTNLFSDKATLAEQMGFEKFNDEFFKYAPYYQENFY